MYVGSKKEEKNCSFEGRLRGHVRNLALTLVEGDPCADKHGRLFHPTGMVTR